MSTEQLLCIGDVDLSEYITADCMSVRYTPVYDENSEFTAIDGNTSGTFLGHRIHIGVTADDIPEDTAQSLAELFSGEDFSVRFSVPSDTTADFTPGSLTLEPIRMTEDGCYYSAVISMTSGVIAPQGL